MITKKRSLVGSERKTRVFRVVAISFLLAAFANSAAGENYEWIERRHACVVQSAAVLQYKASGLKPSLSEWLNAPASFVVDLKSCRTPPSSLDRGWSGCLSEDQILLRIEGSKVSPVPWEPSFSYPSSPQFQTLGGHVILFEPNGQFHFSKPSFTDEGLDDQGFFAGRFGWFSMSGTCAPLNE